MAPKRVGRVAVKAKARAARQAKNAKRDARRAAMVQLNDLAVEVGAAPVQVFPRSAAAEDVQRAIRVLDPRCQQEPALAARLHAVVKAWADNGGRLEAELAPPPDLDRPSVLFKHRVLLPTFRLKSRAFMLTYNSRLLQRGSWESFGGFVSNLKGRIGARAWAANLEQSLHAVADDLVCWPARAPPKSSSGIGCQCAAREATGTHAPPDGRSMDALATRPLCSSEAMGGEPRGLHRAFEARV